MTREKMSKTKLFELYEFQKRALERTADRNRVAYYLDMGLGKTFVGSVKALSMKKTILIICQKSKVKDWVAHFADFYGASSCTFDLTRKKGIDAFVWETADCPIEHRMNLAVGVINYDLIIRRPQLGDLKDFTLMLDESSVIQNENSMRSTYIRRILNPRNLVLLSGTPTGGKYERLWSQLSLLGWNIDKRTFLTHYVDWEYETVDGFPRKKIKGYKNVERLKRKMREYGCFFMKAEEAFDLPDQQFVRVDIPKHKKYEHLRKERVLHENFGDWVCDSSAKLNVCMRWLCGAYSEEKISALKDILDSCYERIVVFYNFKCELEALKKTARELGKEFSEVNGERKDTEEFDTLEDGLIFVQYQSGAMGLNLQSARICVFFTPTRWSELHEQAKKRIHRIGQSKKCIYYELVCKNTLEETIYERLKMYKDYTDDLFRLDE